MEKPKSRRLWEIDALRGFALVLMITYHLLYDLNEFYQLNIAYDKGIFFLTGKTAAILFILIAGISCTFNKNNTPRAFKLIAWGYVIFIVMYVAVPGSNIIFGILQFLGVCLLLSPIFKNFPPYLLIALGTTIILAGEFVSKFSPSFNWLAPLGFWGPNFSSVDYFPLIPWFGVFLLGISVSKIAYKEKRSLIKLPEQYFEPLIFVGKHTLLVYLVHQPILMALLFLFFRVI